MGFSRKTFHPPFFFLTPGLSVDLTIIPLKFFIILQWAPWEIYAFPSIVVELWDSNSFYPTYWNFPSISLKAQWLCNIYSPIYKVVVSLIHLLCSMKSLIIWTFEYTILHTLLYCLFSNDIFGWFEARCKLYDRW